MGQTIVAPLLAWWDGHKAAWPWRAQRDPYAIWIAEVMLQQTQIATVIPYYERWLARFPTVADLAAASLTEVLKQWQGLGYYRRAQHLHAAAQQLMSQYGGQLPPTAAELRQLKGIGPYTAGAIASIAFNQQAAIVDGNIMRVLTRLADIDAPIKQTATQKQLWQMAQTLVPADRPGDYNQALMELGQTICLPTTPDCFVCPLRPHCLAHQRGTQLERPVRPRRATLPHYPVAAGVIWREDGHFLIAQRPLTGLLGGLWEFPGGKQEANETLPQTLQREIAEELGIQITVGAQLCTVPHAYTHFRITLHAFHAYYHGGPIQHLGVADHAWVTLADLANYPFAVTDQKIIAALVEEKVVKSL